MTNSSRAGGRPVGLSTEDFVERRVVGGKEIRGEDDRVAERDLNRLLLDIVHVTSSGDGKSPCQPASRQAQSPESPTL